MQTASLLDQIREKAKNNREKGFLFERVVQELLRKAPIYSERFSDVWLWNEWPKRKGPDTGIDLVAQEKESGKLWAVQCKCYDESRQIEKKDIDSFFTASGKSHFQQRLIVSSTDLWSRHAEDAIHNQSLPCQRLRLQDIVKYFDNYDIRYPERAKLKSPKKLRPHQEEAIQKTLKQFKTHERGKLIMACGTGKTFTALHIAEHVAAPRGLVLFVVPSISLLSQAMQEWAQNFNTVQHHFAVCSDAKVGKDNEDMSLSDLCIPPTTDAMSLYTSLREKRIGMTVVFSTYQSLDVISQAQKKGVSGLSPFDLIICDEAHRTTGIEQEGEEVSFFSKIHNNAFIQGNKRLYMTATPRLYGEGAKAKAKERKIGVVSMDDEEIYGPEFYRLDFSEAVNRDLLSDYKVLVFGVSEKFIAKTAQVNLAKSNEIGVDYAAKIIACYNALRFQDTKKHNPLKRAVAFCTTIKASKQITESFSEVVNEVQKNSQSNEKQNDLRCEVEHVDGTTNSLERNRKLDWLRQDSKSEGEEVCRILSNARCLSEGIDVPALDAVLFVNPRKSQVDIVQAVGRVMRKSPGKEYGFIILPIVVEAGITPDKALDNNERYSVVWDVLRALRSHDNRFNSWVNKLGINTSEDFKNSGQVIIGRVDDKGKLQTEDEKTTSSVLSQMEFSFSEWGEAIYAKLVEKCGDRKYWDLWARDVADIAGSITTRIQALLAKRGAKQSELTTTFEAFLQSLRDNIHPEIDKEEAVDMLSQHIITQPVFDALFEDYTFSKHNPVSLSMQKVVGFLEEQGLKKETESLQAFYDSVRSRASGIDNLEGRQRVVIELYEKFFANAFPKVSERLGIVYTPVELVDFLLRSANDILQKEFGKSLSDERVNILEPFAGTGSFLVRLLQLKGLIKDKDLKRKYAKELHANEIMLLAYYIAAINIEEAYHRRLSTQTKTDYKPFPGIVLADTFQMTENKGKDENRISGSFPTNSKRAEAQLQSPIQVILSNPPWSAGQKSENDANKNLKYPSLDARLIESYVAHSTATSKKNLYDSYIRAIRWASDRIQEGGIIGYVTNGSFLDGNSTDGLRQCLVDEFDSIYCINLRGNQRTAGELSKREGGKIFGQGSRAGVAITLLVKNPKKARKEAEIFYHDIGDYLSREEKLEQMASASLKSLSWQKIIPNAQNDWLRQRNPEFQKYLPLGTEENKATAVQSLKQSQSQEKQRDLIAIDEPKKEPKKASSPSQSLFGLYSLGVNTNRDDWVYHFSKGAVAENMETMIRFYNQQVRGYHKAHTKDPKLRVEDYIDNDPKRIKWSSSLKAELARKKEGSYDQARLRQAVYRPFCKQWLYYNDHFNHRVARTPLIFPKEKSRNLVICVSGKGANAFSVLMVDTLPDIQFASNGQCFPLYFYNEAGQHQENILDTSLELFQEHYKNRKISKEDLFYYIYALLHRKSYTEAYGSDLVKSIPRIPFVKDFFFFAKAGRKLGALHTGYEQEKEYPLRIKVDGGPKQRGSKLKPSQLSLGKMRFGKNESGEKDKSSIVFNSHITLSGIPLSAYDYVVNGKSAIEWVMERYQVKTHKESQITNDPNEVRGGGAYVLSLLQRVVGVSVKSVKIVESLG